VHGCLNAATDMTFTVNDTAMHTATLRAGTLTRVTRDLLKID